jgi:hypothetical protein
MNCAIEPKLRIETLGWAGITFLKVSRVGADGWGSSRNRNFLRHHTFFRSE